MDMEMRFVGEANFREFYHRFMYVEGRDVLEEVVNEYLEEGDTGAVFYGYIDEQAGVSFQIAGLASVNEGKLQVRKLPEGIMAIFRIGSIINARFINLSMTNMYTDQFTEFEKLICTAYDTDNEMKEEIRSLCILDGCRHPEYPDDIAVFLIGENLQPEQVWVRADYLHDSEIRGELLNEPNADFGIHCGDSIPIIPCKQRDGSIVCLSSRK